MLYYNRGRRHSLACGTRRSADLQAERFLHGGLQRARDDVVSLVRKVSEMNGTVVGGRGQTFPIDSHEDS